MGSSSKSELTVAAGICTIVGTVTAYSLKKRWEDVHTVAVIVGAVLTIVGATN
jgi:Sec-independent protein secretion pathway component TatC